MPAAGIAVAPGQANMMAGYTGNPMGPAPNGMSQLERLNAIDVKEKANVLQELTAMFGMEIEMANKYQILDTAGNQHFFAVEKTDCCRRQMQQFMSVQRPCGCTCCCFNRPVANVVDDVTKQKIGSFRDPCTCWSLQFQVRDERDDEVLTVDGGCCCCQPGIWCPLPCGPWSEVAFDVKDTSSGTVVAHITKRVPSCLAWMFAPDIDNYHVTFEQVQSPQWKAILMAFTIFMDFRYFNTNRNEGEAQRLERDFMNRS